MKANGDPIEEDNATLVNGGRLLRTSILTIGSTKVDHTSSLINFTKDYAASEATNMFYYSETSYFTDR